MKQKFYLTNFIISTETKSLAPTKMEHNQLQQEQLHQHYQQ